MSQEKTVEHIGDYAQCAGDEGRGRFDFSFSPKEFLDAQRAAEKDKLDVIGIFHTPPGPPLDPVKPMRVTRCLQGGSILLPPSMGGTFKEAKAWWRRG